MSDKLNTLVEFITASLANEVTGAHVAYGELTVTANAEQIEKVLNFFKLDPELRFSVLIDICGVDYPARPKRFDVVYHLLSLHRNLRARIKIETDEKTPVPSAVEIYPAAGWFEREAWDLYGIMFAGHPDLRRLLTDYGFQGHPLRKDFPLTGFVELRYSEEQKRVVYKPVELTQGFRTFDFMSPWEGAEYILPGEDNNDAGSTEAKT